MKLSDFDPTSKRSKLGGFVRAGIGALPGGSTALGVLDQVNAGRAAETDRSTADDTAKKATAPEPGPVAAFFRKPLVLIGGAVLVLGGLAFAIFRKR